MIKISEIIGESIETAWKYKMLWVFALMIGSSSAGLNFFRGVNSALDRPSPGEEIPQDSNFQKVLPPGITDGLNNNVTQLASADLVRPDIIETEPPVLDESYYDNPEANKFTRMFDELKSIIPYYLVPLGVVILILITFIVFIMVLVRTWAEGSLLSASSNALSGENISLRRTATVGRIYLKELIKYKLLVIAVGISILFSTVFFIPLLFIDNPNKTLLILFGLVLGVFIALGFFVLRYSARIGTRYIVLGKKGHRTALKLGFYIFRKYLWQSLILAFANSIIKMFGSLLYLIVALVPVFVITAVLTLLGADTTDFMNYSSLVAGAAVIGVLYGAAFVMGLVALGGFFGAYDFLAWNKFYEQAITEGGGTRDEL